MTIVPIPSWNAEGLISPIDVASPASVNRSPYKVSLTDIILRFASSSERVQILDGFLRFRSAMHTLGLIDGFQWVNGSFTENVETSARNRPPSDIDIVTFYRVPSGKTQQDLIDANPSLFPSNLAEQLALKSSYKVDSYTVHLGGDSVYLVNRSAYWYGMWAHQRDTYRWKGFLEVDLDPSDDISARSLLSPYLLGGTP